MSQVDKVGREPDFPYLNLRRWPFDIVPSEDGVTRWVGRPTVAKKLTRLVSSASRVPTSRIVLLWATFGSGKSHALRHIEHLANERGGLTSVYVVVPRGMRSFLDIYTAVVDSMGDKGLLARIGQSVLQSKGPEVDSDVQRALVRLAVGSEEERRVASAWLRADRVPIRDLRSVGLTRRVETVADAVRVLDDLITASHSDGSEFVLLLDEMQELEELDRRLPECVGGLHKIFDLNPRGLTIVLSFTTGSRTNVESIIGQALFSRAAEFISLPPLDAEEAAEFVRELLRTWSVDPGRVPFPFVPSTIDAAVSHLLKRDGGVPPRVLMKAFDQILRDAEVEIADGEMDTIGPSFAKESLASFTEA